MPNRVIREGILESDQVNKLSWAAEVFYRRLHQVADDFGCFDGRSSILRAKLFPLRLEVVSTEEIEKYLSECVNAGLVKLYRHDSKPYLIVLKFNQTIRIKKRKYPEPSEFDKQMHADASHEASTCVSESNSNQSESVSQTGDEAGFSHEPSKTKRISIDFLRDELINDQNWLEISSSKLANTVDEILSSLDRFIIHLKSIEMTKKTREDFLQHFFNWNSKLNSNNFKGNGSASRIIERW